MSSAIGRNRLWTVGPERACLGFNVTTDGSGDPGTPEGYGVVSASKQATGHYRVTLDRVWPAIEAVIPSYAKDDLTTDLMVRVKAYDASAKTVDVCVYDVSGAAAADLVSGELHFLVFVRNTGLS